MNNYSVVALDQLMCGASGAVDHAFASCQLQALKTGKSDRSTATRIGKMPVLNDFQFFNVKRLTELYEKEHAAEQHRALMAQKEAALKGQVRVRVLVISELFAAACADGAQVPQVGAVLVDQKLRCGIWCQVITLISP